MPSGTAWNAGRGTHRPFELPSVLQVESISLASPVKQQLSLLFGLFGEFIGTRSRDLALHGQLSIVSPWRIAFFDSSLQFECPRYRTAEIESHIAAPGLCDAGICPELIADHAVFVGKPVKPFCEIASDGNDWHGPLRQDVADHELSGLIRQQEEEVIAVPQTAGEPETLLAMVHEINEMEVALEERLTDSIYPMCLADGEYRLSVIRPK